MYIKIDDDTVVALNGDEYRRASTDEWKAYESWLAGDNEPQEVFTDAQWAVLNANAKMRLRTVGPETRKESDTFLPI